MHEVLQISARTASALSEGVEECWMDFDGIRMRYLRAGSGPPLILLHGLLAYSFSWRFTLSALAPYATLYAPDLPGAGFSDRPVGIDHSMRATAKRVLRFVENLGLSSFDLLGTSRGGAVAMAAAAECMSAGGCQAQLRRLVLVCPVNPYSSHGRWLAPFFATRIGATLFRTGIACMPFLFPFSEHALSIVRTWTDDLRELQALLPRLAPVPTLLLWGSKDSAVYVSSMEPLARHFANVQTVVFPGVGHMPYEECPEEFNRELTNFLIAPEGSV
jgi:pimeloyl-ACP methyl ester carboxylesterase